MSGEQEVNIAQERVGVSPGFFSRLCLRLQSKLYRCPASDGDGIDSHRNSSCDVEVSPAQKSHARSRLKNEKPAVRSC